MHEINKERFGAFVAALRKEKGYTQQQLAEKLYISNKAISKWETGVSIPDVAMLIPLSEALGVTVTELLRCERLPADVPLNSHQVEDLMKTAITYSEPKPKGRMRRRGLAAYFCCLVLAIAEVALLYHLGFTRLGMEEPISTVMVLCPIFGLYFMGLAAKQLPRYYDDYRISAFSDGPLRMNLPGVRISNRNWPHIVRVGQIWSMGMLVGYPLLQLAAMHFTPHLWLRWEKAILLVLMLGGLLLPMTLVGKKYE
ncbi:MAG: helix-turn-helix transcriptional regulator [Oscillospiraceae bacterium]|nr:helix-turn-helix transcriptional regulator [Oscillospiraceae bacterium]